MQVASSSAISWSRLWEYLNLPTLLWGWESPQPAGIQLLLQTLHVAQFDAPNTTSPSPRLEPVMPCFESQDYSDELPGMVMLE